MHGTVVRPAHLIRLALLKKGIILIAIIRIVRGPVARPPGSELVFFVKILRGIGGKCGFRLRIEGWVCHRIRQGPCATEVDDIAEGDKARSNKGKAEEKSVRGQQANSTVTYKMMTPRITVAVLSLHLEALPYANASQPVFGSLLLLCSASPLLFPSATYDATATQALNHRMTNRQSMVAKA